MKIYKLSLDNGETITMSLDENVTSIEKEIPKLIAHLNTLFPDGKGGHKDGKPDHWIRNASKVISHTEA